MTRPGVVRSAPACTSGPTGVAPYRLFTPTGGSQSVTWPPATLHYLRSIESGVSLGKDGRNPIGKDLHDFDQSYCARGEHAGEPPRPFSVHAGTRSAWLKLCERFWQERPTGGSDEGRLSTSSTPSSGSISRELSPTVQSPASDAPLCPLASALPAGVLLIPADTSPSVRPKNPIALMGQPTLAVPTSSHSGTHASSL